MVKYSEHSEYFWLTPDEVLQRFPHPVYGPALAQFKAHFGQAVDI